MLDIAHAGAKYGLSISQVATNGFVASLIWITKR